MAHGNYSAAEIAEWSISDVYRQYYALALRDAIEAP